MTDLRLAWSADRFAADLAIEGGRLATDDGLRTAILISLFTDARAPDDAELPETGGDRRGWWGDTQARPEFAGGPDAGSATDRNRVGSLLWLLARAKALPRVLAQAHQACEEALDWLVRDGVARAVRVVVEQQGDRMAIGVEIDRPIGPDRQRFDYTWDASTGAITAGEYA